MAGTRLAVIDGAGDVRRMTLATSFDAAIDRVWEAMTSIEKMKVWWPDWQPGGI